MGAVSAEYSDYIILTEEDYRNEPVRGICNQIAMGVKSNGFEVAKKGHKTDKKTYEIIVSRKEAIYRAIEMADNGDVVVLTGKSHEKSLNRNGKEYPWDEYKVAKSAIKEYGK